MTKLAKLSDLGTLIKQYNEDGYALERDLNFVKAEENYLNAIQLVEKKCTNLKNLVDFLRTWSPTQDIGNYQDSDTSSRYLSGKYIVDILALSFLKQSENADPMACLKKAQNAIQSKGFDFPFEELEKLLEPVLDKSDIPGNVPKDLQKHVAWSYAHCATMHQRLALDQLDYRKIKIGDLHTAKFHYLISLIFNSEEAWTFAQLGDTYRNIGNLAIFRMIKPMRLAKDFYFDLSFECFNIAKKKMEQVNDNPDNMGLAWVNAHWGASILNARREKKYPEVLGMQTESRNYYEQTKMGAETYHWLQLNHAGYHWLKTVKNILRDDENRTDINVAYNIFSGTSAFLKGTSEKPVYLQQRIEPNEMSRDLPVQLSISILVHVHQWDAPSEGEKRLLKLVRLVGRDYISPRLDKSKDLFKQFIVPSYDDSMEIVRTAYYYLIADGALKGEPVLESALPAKILHKFIKYMALGTITMLTEEDNKKSFLLADSQTKDQMPAVLWQSFEELTDREKYLSCAEVVNYLFRLQQFEKSGIFSMEQDFTFENYKKFLEALDEILDLDSMLDYLAENKTPVGGIEILFDLETLQNEIYRHFFSTENHATETSVLTALGTLDKC